MFLLMFSNEELLWHSKFRQLKLCQCQAILEMLDCISASERSWREIAINWLMAKGIAKQKDRYIFLT